MARQSNQVRIPAFVGEPGEAFWYCRLSEIDQATHQLDRDDSAREMIEAIHDDAARWDYRRDQLIEEAINSSVLEGARLSTRAAAKALIREGRAPLDVGERMVLNNYNAMQRLLDLKDKRLTLEDLLEIHRVLAEGALEQENAAGRLRYASENVRVEDSMTGTVWFTPPPADSLQERLARMLEFANEEGEQPFMHPVLRAIVLHFWLAYLHPFVDGNGRMARALFYWQMLRSGYDTAQYLSISGPIETSRRSYYLAFAHTETDHGDLTYFVLHQLKVLRRATNDLREHLRERSQRLKQLADAVSTAETLNHRQQNALVLSIRNPHIGVTVHGHKNAHAVTYITARKDLQELVEQGYLRRVRAGRSDRYFPTESLASRLSR
jgi:Fic family protein